MKETFSDEEILAFLKGRGDPEERAAFAERLTTEPELAQKTARLRIEMAVSELLIAEETRALLQRWRAQKRQSAFIGTRPRLIAVVLAGLLMLAGALWYFLTRPVPTPPPAEQHHRSTPQQALEPESEPIAQGPVTSSRRAEDYRRRASRLLPDPPLPNFRHALTTGSDDPVAQAQRAYAAGDYTAALDLLAQADSTRRQTAAFWAAHALFRLERYDEAAERFAALIAQGSRQYRYAAEWGLLLCYYAQLPTQAPAFRRQLQAILAQHNHPYFEQAKEIANDRQ